MQLYIKVAENRIDDIKYICSCDPAANVAVEILCTLVKGKTLEESAAITEQDFFRFIGCESEELGKRAKNLLELFSNGIRRIRDLA